MNKIQGGRSRRHTGAHEGLQKATVRRDPKSKPCGPCGECPALSSHGSFDQKPEYVKTPMWPVTSFCTAFKRHPEGVAVHSRLRRRGISKGLAGSGICEGPWAFCLRPSPLLRASQIGSAMKFTGLTCILRFRTHPAPQWVAEAGWVHKALGLVLTWRH